MSMLRQPIALPIPVPKAFATASLPAKRAARWRSGNFIDIEYSISPSVKTRCRKRSPNRSIECWMREHSITSTPIPITLILLPRPSGPGVVGQALRLPHRAMATGAVALQHCCSVPHSFERICHSGEHFLDRIFQADPHRLRYDCVTDVEFGQTRNLVDERYVFVIDAVTGVDLHIGF